MDETKHCKCGKSSVRIEPVGEDWFGAYVENIKSAKVGYALEFRCLSCGELVDSADPFMIVNSYSLLNGEN